MGVVPCGYRAKLPPVIRVRGEPIFLLPVDVMVGLPTALMIAAMAALAIWNGVYISLAARRTPALSILLPARTH